MIGQGQQANDALLPCRPVWKSQDQTKGANELSETRTRITHRQNWRHNPLQRTGHGHTLVCLICKNFVDRIRRIQRFCQWYFHYQRSFHVVFNKEWPAYIWICPLLRLHCGNSLTFHSQGSRKGHTACEFKRQDDRIIRMYSHCLGNPSPPQADL